MSLYEVASESQIYSYTMSAMIAGTIVNAVAMPNFAGKNSHILGCVRVTVGGTIGNPYARQATGLSTFPVIQIVSDNIADTSVYRIYWTNETSESQIASVLSC